MPLPSVRAIELNSYRAQTLGKVVPPTDLSSFARHNFSIVQLQSYAVSDKGGDSYMMAKALDQAFFECDTEADLEHKIHMRGLISKLQRVEYICSLLRENGPGIFS